MPDFPIIDSHVHLYDPARLSYPGIESVPLLNRAHLPEDFFAASAPVDVEALVFVEVDAAPGAYVEEARFVEELAAQEPRIQALVAHLPLHSNHTLAEEIRNYAAMPLARGVRTLIQNHDDEPGWALHEGFVDNVRALAEHGLSFDLCLRHSQLADTIELVRRCPDVSFVLDHIAKPGIRESLQQPWKHQLAELATATNVWCKLSGVVTEADHQRWTPEEITPYVAHAIDCFGYDRVLFGGDWPVSRLACDYPRWVSVLDGIVAGASDAEKRKLYRNNAIQCYRLPVR